MNTNHDGRTCLTIHQPWAWLIVNGFKDIENRVWQAHYRGRLYIHAGKKFDDEGYAAVKKAFPEIQLPAKADFVFGAIIGSVNLKSCTAGDNPSKWAMPGQWHWTLDNPVILPAEPMRGAQGLFIAGNQKRVIELPAGFITRTRKNPGGHGFDCTLYRGHDIAAAVEEGSYHSETREGAITKAIARAHHLHSLPGLETLTTPCCPHE